jgi:hypothetical protein
VSYPEKTKYDRSSNVICCVQSSPFLNRLPRTKHLRLRLTFFQKILISPWFRVFFPFFWFSFSFYGRPSLYCRFVGFFLLLWFFQECLSKPTIFFCFLGLRHFPKSSFGKQTHAFRIQSRVTEIKIFTTMLRTVCPISGSGTRVTSDHNFTHAH